VKQGTGNLFLVLYEGCIHPLKGNRHGQFAVSLTGFYRLIFTLHGDALEIANIEQVSKHYDD